MKHISQLDLISAIMLHLEKKEHVEALNNRQVNAIIHAANGVVEALAQGHKPVKPNMGVFAWLNTDETGLSSKYMASVLSKSEGIPLHIPCEQNHPHDPGDFGRCVGLLDAAPALRSHIHVLANGHGPEWAALASNWDWLEALYRDELPSGEAPRLYAEMQRLFAIARKDT